MSFGGFMGTPEYMSPEIINNTMIGSCTDYWSLGVIIYQLIAGYTPFTDKTEYLIFEKVMKIEPKFTEAFSDEAIDLITRLLSKNPADRIFDIKSHPFFNSFEVGKCVEDVQRIINISHNLIPEVASDIEMVSPGNQLMKQGVLKKRNPWFRYYKRLVCLFDYPKIEYLDPLTNTTKGTVYLDKSCKAEVVSHNKFELKTPNRNFMFKCNKKDDIMGWVVAINDVIEKFSP
jgi:serine/threonine protein kinase